MRFSRLFLTVPLLAVLGARPPVRAPKYTQIYTLNAKEGVFAYARISPDGRTLVYASEVQDMRRPNRIATSETVVDLTTRKVLYTEDGIDAYWSIDGTRIIYSGQSGVSIRHMDKGTVAPNVAPGGLGDYYSWAERDGKDLIMTINSNYYYLNGDKAVLPYSKVSACPAIKALGDPQGTGQRPLISKDGKRITTFVSGNVVVRGLDNCNDIINTGMQGAKADWSWDGRYIAFHMVKPDQAGYEIRIVDLQQKTVRTLSGLKGNALFPSWTKDGRLCFRYDGPDYRGFMMASNVLDAEAVPLPAVPTTLPAHEKFSSIFPGSKGAAQHLELVLIWAPWSAHSQIAFTALGAARDYFAKQGASLAIAAAADPGSPESDVTHQMDAFGVSLPRLPLTPHGLALTQAKNQMPATLLFKDGVLVDRKLGALSFDELRDWVGDALKELPKQ